MEEQAESHCWGDPPLQPLHPGCSWLSQPWQELPWENAARRRQSLYFSGSFPSCPALGAAGARMPFVGSLNSWVGVPSRREQAVLWGYAAPAGLVLRVVLPRPRYPCPGQFPSMVLWVWNKLALMAPALILCGRIPRDSRAITGRAALPSTASSPSSRCSPPRRWEDSAKQHRHSGSARSLRLPGHSIPRSRGQSRVVRGPVSDRAPRLAQGDGTERRR